MRGQISNDYSIFQFDNHALKRKKEDSRSRSGAAARQSPVEFHSVFDFPGWDKAPEWVLNLIESHGSENVLEVGSGANPTLSSEIVSARKIRYTANDISLQELNKADKVFDRWVCDLSREAVPGHMRGRFDLVFSRMVNEHVSDGHVYHQNIHSLLKPGGLSAHCFSTLYCLPFTINRILPDSVSGLLLNIFRPRDSHKLGKFRAYYSWSRGPSRAMLSRFEALGFEILEYRGYFGHGYYSRIPLLHRLESIKARMLLARPIPALCSYGMVIARKLDRAGLP